MAAFGKNPFTVAPLPGLPLRWEWRYLRLFTDSVPFSVTLGSILLVYGIVRSGTRRLIAARATESSGERTTVNPRTALLTTSAAGPIAGFIVAMSATGYGLLHALATNPQSARLPIHLSAPEAIALLRQGMLASYPDIPSISTLQPNPILLAGWVGLIMIAIHLLPVGRLDGGSILYSLSPRVHRITSNVAIGLLVYLGVVEWAGWLLLVLLLLQPWMRHPRVTSPTPPQIECLPLVPICVAIFLLAATTQPIAGMSLTQLLIHTR